MATAAAERAASPRQDRPVWVAGPPGLAVQTITKLREDIDSHRELSTSLGITADDNGVPVRVG